MAGNILFDNRELELAHRLADTAGDILRRYFRTAVNVEQKADNSPVTKADRECEAALRKLIEQTFPDHGIVGEEYGNVRSSAPSQWVLDPIDGTRAFIAGTPTFTTLIALVKNNVPMLGIIDQPVSKERWVGIVGDPTTCSGKAARSSVTVDLGKAAIATTSTNYFTPQEAAAFEQLKTQCAKIILGGDAYLYAKLASGEIDIVIDASLKPYDFCALPPVVEGAGGVITGWDGKALTLNSNGRIIAAANQKLHANALKIIQAALA